MHRDPVISEGEQRQFKCLHRIEQVDPNKEHGFRWHCLKCGKWMLRKNGVVVSLLAQPATGR